MYPVNLTALLYIYVSTITPTVYIIRAYHMYTIITNTTSTAQNLIDDNILHIPSCIVQTLLP